MPSARLLTILLTCALLLPFPYGGAAAQSRPETDKDALDALSIRLQAKFLAGRGPAYQQLLRSTDPAQVALNEAEDIQLMYVDETGRPYYYVLENMIAARTVSTRLVWPGQGYGHSLTGSGTTLGKLGIWDGGGVRTSHQEFGGRVTQMDGASGTSGHATHVAGTMVAAGAAAAAKGMSYEANLAAYDFTNDESEMASAASSGMNVSNHSYGYVAGWNMDGDWYWWGNLSVSTTEDYHFGFYDSHAQDWDNIAYSAPYYTIVNSAGNDRDDYGPQGSSPWHYHWDGGWVWADDFHEIDGGADHYDCLSSPHTAKNLIVVGAVNDIYDGYTQPSDVVVTGFSSWGPTDDGRIKPDVVGNGQGLYSCNDAGDTEYTTMSGTSMSSPNVAGSVNLLVRHYEDTHGSTTPLSSTIKAVVIQTADEAGDSTGPDYTFGWGLLNTLHAADAISADAESPIMIQEDYLADVGGGDADTLYFYSTGIDPLRLTLAWTDPAGTPPPVSLNPTTPMLVNDLDLRVVYTAGPTTYYPYILDPSNPADAATTGDNYRDNVEQIYIDSPAAGEYMAIISHKGNLTADQWYSLVCSEPMDETGHDSTAPSVTVTDPNGGESWTAETEHEITWIASDAHGVDYVDIYYSYDGGFNYTLVAPGETNDSTYTWTVPNTPTDSAVVKVIAYDPWTNAGEDTSDAFFTIVPPPDTTAPSVTVIDPNGGETWYAGTTQNITWSATDAVGVDSVGIYYSINGGGDYFLIASQEANDGVYPWTVPSNPSTSALIKVVAYDPSLNEGEDVSDAVFTIALDSDPPVVTLIAPNGGDTLWVDELYDISWTAYDPTFAASDDFEDGNDNGWTHVCYNPNCSYTVSGGVYELTSDPGPAVSTLDASNTWSDYIFEADVRIDAGTTRTLLFRFADTYTYYKLRLVPARAVLTRHTILSDTTLVTVSGLSYSTGVWYSVSIVALGANIKVSVDGDALIDVTDPDPILSGPVGLRAESSNTALFDNVLVARPDDIASVDLHYSTDGGSTFPHIIATGEPNDLLYEWTVPNTPTSTAMVRVTAYDQVSSTGEDESDAVFTIALFDTTDPSVTVTAPNGGETWYVGNAEDITWTASDASGVDSVSIYYSVNAGGDYSLVASQEPNDGVYPWTIPDTPTTDALVKVVAYDPSLNEGEDVSDAVFTIAPPPDTTDPSVTVTAPNGGETWYVGGAEDITWTASDASGVDSVSIYYSVNAGGDYSLVASQEPNDGVYPWTIPDTPTTDALVKVVAYDPSLNEGDDVSDAVFTIAPPPDITDPLVTVLTPDKNDSLEIGTVYDITWTATDENGVDSVSIYYSLDGGGDYSLIASQEPNDGVYPWTVPGSPCDSLTVRIIAFDPSLNTGEDESDSLNVIYDVTVGVPGGGRDLGDAVLLWQNTPNPFSPRTNISFYLPQEASVFLEVFDAKGRLVEVLIDGRNCGAGVTTIPWSATNRDGGRLSSGIYFYRLKTGGVVKTRKMVIAH